MLYSSPRFYFDLLKYVATFHSGPKGVANGDKLNRETGSENIDPSKSLHTAEPCTEPKMNQLQQSSLDDWRYEQLLKKAKVAMSPTKDMTSHMQTTEAMLHSGIPVYQPNAHSANGVSQTSYILSDVVSFDESDESKHEYPRPYPTELHIAKPGKSGPHKDGGHPEDFRVEFDLPMRGKAQSMNREEPGANCMAYAMTESTEYMEPEAWTGHESEDWAEQEPKTWAEQTSDWNEQKPQAWNEW